MTPEATLQAASPRLGGGGSPRLRKPALLKRHSVLPGFGLSLGYSVFYLSLLVLIPLAGLFLKSASLSPQQFWNIVTAPRVVASYQLSFGASFVAAAINLVFGLLIAWVLVRYRFPGKGLINGMVDLPFALPTAVAGIALTAVYSQNGVLGAPLEAIGIKAAYSQLGVVIAMVFIGLPFVVRTVQPVLEDLEVEVEEAAATLGANRWQTFTRVIFPYLAPAAVTGFAMAFARALGEYGSVVFISGNMPGKTEITPLLIMTKLEQFDYTGATAVAAVTLIASFGILLCINLLQARSRRAGGTHGR